MTVDRLKVPLTRLSTAIEWSEVASNPGGRIITTL
jgi:hypothetical protein